MRTAFRTVSLVAACTIALLTAMSCLAADAARPLGKYRHRVWRATDGLPSSAIVEIAQDRKGYLWISTDGGAARFDGSKLEVVDASPTGVTTNWVTGMYCCDARGDIWMAYYDRLVRYSGTEAKVVRRERLLACVLGTPDGTIWVGTEHGRLLKLAPGGKVTLISAALPSGGAMAIAAAGGTLWLGGTGITRIDNGSMRFFGARDGLPGTRVDSLLAEANGDLWIGTDQGLARMRGGRFESLAPLHPALKSPILALLKDSQGTLWIGTRGAGVVRMRDDRVIAADTWPLSDTSVTTIFEDREHNYWIGTEYGGVNQFRDTPFTSYGEADGIGSRNVTSVTPSRAGGVWVGTSDGGISRIDSAKQIHTYSEEAGVPLNMMASLAETPSGGLWAGTRTAGLLYFDGKKVTRRITNRNGLAGIGVSALLLDRDSLWIGPFAGELQRWQDGRLTTYARARSGLRGRSFISMAKASDGGLWLATERGLEKFRDGAAVSFLGEDGLRDAWIRGIVEDESGNVWAATSQQGLARLAAGKVTWISTAAGLCREQTSLLDDGHGNFWIGCVRRIVRVAKRDLDAYAAGSLRTIPLEWFDAQDGLRSDETNIGSARARDGSLWFSTVDGVATIMLGRREILGAPPIVPQTIEVDGRTVDASHPVAAGAKRLVFFFTSPSFSFPERVRFRYRLEGFDTAWVDADRLRHAVYTNIPPGRYSFHAQATLDGRHWSDVPVAMPLTLRPTVTQTVWFHAAMLLGALLTVLVGAFFLHARRVRSLRENAKELERVVAERTLLLAQEKEGAVAAAMVNAELSRKNQLILDSAAEGICGIDAAGRTTFVNLAGARMLEWQPDELVGRELHPLVHPDRTADNSLCPFCRVGQTSAASHPFEFVTRSGRRIPLDCTSATMRTPAGELQGAVITFRDVSERVAVEQMKDEFIATVSHELRTPLTSIRGALGIVASGLVGALGAKAQRMLDIAVGSTDRLIRMVNDILDIERLSTGRFELERTTFVCSQVMQQTADVMQAMADRAGVHIGVEPIDAELYADADRITQTLTNLVSNAIKFSSPGTNVRLWAGQDESSVTFHVSDEGRGIPSDKLQLVFERFRQVDASDAREKGGSGLGLSICRNIAQAHGGSIEVTSRVGQGTTFSVTIPTAAVDATTAA